MTTTGAAPIDPMVAAQNLLRLAAGSLRGGDHGHVVLVNAYYLADLLEQAADNPGQLSDLPMTDPAVKIADVIVDWDPGDRPGGPGQRHHLEPVR